MQKLPITVLMPAYNAGPYIREAVDSVLSQTYTDFEFIIINDGSTDDTAQILNSYSDPRIKVIHQDNIKLIKTLNKGLALANGKYIARFDADDVCMPERLKTQMDFFDLNPDHILVGSDAEYMDKEGNYLFTFNTDLYTDEEIRASKFKTCPFIHSSATYLKDAVLKAGGYNEDAITFEDHLLWRDLAAFGKMANLPQELIKVRFSPESVTMDENWRGKEFSEIKRISVENGYVTPEDALKIKKILKKQDVKKYQHASYYSLIGKKYLWNQYDPGKARKNLRDAIKLMPFKTEPYLLYFLSFLPQKVISSIYNKAKGKN